MPIGNVALWGILAALFLVIELLTVSLVSIWFTAGALAALVAAALGAPFWLQLVLFLGVSGVCFAALYPKLRRQLQNRRQATNADMVVGQTCVVTQRIDNLAGTGAVSVAGKVWSARTEDGTSVEEGACVTALRIEGVKLIVAPAPVAAATQV